MIETVMFFALGFLVASLCALMALPAVNARATRLARRRLEGLFPLSVAEIAAEKDYLRARFAVSQRRLERKVEAARASRHTDMAVIGARTLEIAALAREVEARDVSLSTTRETLDGVAKDRDAARADGALGLATLEVLEEAHRALLDDRIASREAALAAAAPDQAATDPDETETEIADLRRRHAALETECASLKADLAAAQAALARRAEVTESETAELRKRISDVADVLMRGDRLPAVKAFSMAPAASGLS